MSYVIQAAIASLHMEDPRDWPQIAALYGELVGLTGSAVVELNRAIAVAEAEGTDAGLALVDRLDLDGYQYFHSTRADLLRRLGRTGEARAEYERALSSSRTRILSGASWNVACRSRRRLAACPLPLRSFVVRETTRTEGEQAMLWTVVGTTIATLVFLVPGLAVAYYVLDLWIDDPESYDRIVAAVERAQKRTPKVG